MSRESDTLQFPHTDAKGQMHPLSVGVEVLPLEKVCPRRALFPHFTNVGGQRGAPRLFLSNHRICPT